MSTEPIADPARPGAGTPETWIVLPTYNEAGNLQPIIEAVQRQLPQAIVLVVDDDSPDGTGRLADAMARRDGRVRVLHRQAKQGLGRAYLAGFEVALAAGAERVVQMDADFSHDPRYLPSMLAATMDEPDGRAAADLVIGSRYVKGGGVVDWSIVRKVISRGGSTFAGLVLGLPQHDLTGGFKVWRASLLERLPRDEVHAGGYVFQIEMTFLADRHGARIAELPIVFPDRKVGVSKMSKRIVFEALAIVVQLRWAELRRGRAAAYGESATRLEGNS